MIDDGSDLDSPGPARDGEGPVSPTPLVGGDVRRRFPGLRPALRRVGQGPRSRGLRGADPHRGSGLRASGPSRRPDRAGPRDRPGARAAPRPAPELGARSHRSAGGFLPLPHRPGLVARRARPAHRGLLRLLRQPGPAHAGRGVLAGSAPPRAASAPGLSRTRTALAGLPAAAHGGGRYRRRGGGGIRLEGARAAARRPGDAAASGSSSRRDLRRERHRADLPRFARPGASGKAVT